MDNINIPDLDWTDMFNQVIVENELLTFLEVSAPDREITKNLTLHNQKRQATTNSDFQEIIDREFPKCQYENYKDFCKGLPEIVIPMIRKYKSISVNKDKSGVVGRARRFLKFVSENTPGNKPAIYPEKWYGIAHSILQRTLIEPEFIEPYDRQAIMKLGKSKYKFKTSGREFYNAWKDFNLSAVPASINSLHQKNRHNWKDIILDITNNINEVSLWLEKQNA